MQKKKYYAVRNGRQIGIFNTWAEWEKVVKGYSGAEYKSFYKLEYLKSYKDWLPYIKGTSELTTTEIKTFIEQIRIHAAEFFSFEIPDPDTKQFALFCEYYENINNNF